jgi:hypothetical protein
MEEIEKDSVESEEVNDLLEILQPSKEVIAQASLIGFGIGYNKRIFDCWIKQPSPCCGAASVAGALNFLFATNRKHELSFNHMDILSVYKVQFVEKLISKLKSFERSLGVFTGGIEQLLPILTSLATLFYLKAQELEANTDSSPRKFNVTKSILFATLEKFIAENPESANPENETKPIQSALELFLVSASAALEAYKASPNETDETDADEAEIQGAEPPNQIVTSSGENKSLSSFRVKLSDKISSSTWEIDRELLAILKLISSYHKLNAPFPLTAAIGNTALTIGKIHYVLNFPVFLKKHHIILEN